MGGRQLRCRFIRLLRRFISLLHSLRTFCRCRYQALFQRLSLFGLRLVFPAAAPAAAAVRLSPWRLRPLLRQRRLQAFLLPLCLLALAITLFLQLRQLLLQFTRRLGGFGLLLFQRRLQAFLLLLCL